MPTWSGTYVKFLEAHGVPYPEDVVRIITPLGNAGAARYLISIGLKMSEEEILEHAYNVFDREYATNIGLKSNVKRVLEELKARGYGLAVLTASSHRYVDVCLQKEGVFDLFDEVWSSDDFTYSKAQTEIYVETAKRLGVPLSNCYFCDDNFIALSTSKRAGMNAIGVFDATSAEYEADMRAIAYKYVRDFSELLD